MTTDFNVKFTIAFNDPDLDPEERDEQAQRLMAEEDIYTLEDGKPIDHET
jgi:hypothetical protein